MTTSTERVMFRLVRERWYHRLLLFLFPDHGIPENSRDITRIGQVTFDIFIRHLDGEILTAKAESRAVRD